MNANEPPAQILHELCAAQLLAVLATAAGTAPYASLVAVAITPDLRQLFFATPRATRKSANLAGNRQVALLLDNRSNQVVDFSRAAAATILGTADEIHGDERQKGVVLYLERHPHLAEFVGSPSCAFYRVEIASIFLVTHFQEVIEYHFAP